MFAACWHCCLGIDLAVTIVRCGLLSKMSSLVPRLSTTCLAGPIPPQWANLNKLTGFGVFFNRLSGKLPAVFAPHLIAIDMPANKVRAWGIKSICVYDCVTCLLLILPVQHHLQ